MYKKYKIHKKYVMQHFDILLNLTHKREGQIDIYSTKS